MKRQRFDISLNGAAQVRRVLASIPGILAHREVEDRVLIQSLDAALLTMFKIGHAPFSTLDDTRRTA